MDNDTTPDDQYREDAVKALHLYMHNSWDHSTGPLNDQSLRDAADLWVARSVGSKTSGLVILFLGSDHSADRLARAVVQCAGPDTEPTPQDIAEAHAVIARLAAPHPGS